MATKHKKANVRELSKDERRKQRRQRRLERKIHPTKLRKIAIDYLTIAIGALCYAFAVRTFTVPNDIAPGGVTGISTVVNYLTGLPVGFLYGAINLPMVVIGFIFLGRSVMFKTLWSVLIITVCTDYLYVGLPVYQGDKILASISGGVLMGVALGMTYMREGTSGGTDILTRIIRMKFQHISLGKIMLATDAVVLIVAGIVFQSLDSALYAMISIFVTSKLIDMILYGQLEGKLLLIFSDHFEIITEKIIREIGKGVTILKGYGGYSGREKNVICCAVHKNQYAKLKRLVSAQDPNAFIVITDAGEVLGEGFSENK